MTQVNVKLLARIDTITLAMNDFANGLQSFLGADGMFKDESGDDLLQTLGLDEHGSLINTPEANVKKLFVNAAFLYGDYLKGNTTGMWADTLYVIKHIVEHLEKNPPSKPKIKTDGKHKPGIRSN